MIVCRLCKSAWKKDLSGRGAELTGGRWNSKGVAVLYTSSSRALCMAEIAVHTPLGCLPVDYFMVEIEIPSDAIIKEISEDELPENWQCCGQGRF
jgi:RES domain-containing protein